MLHMYTIPPASADGSEGLLPPSVPSSLPPSLPPSHPRSLGLEENKT